MASFLKGDLVYPLIRTTLSAALASLAFGSSAAGLSPTEERIVEAVKLRSAAALQLLERSVNVNSGTMNFDGVREVGRIFRAEFDALGFRTRWVEMPPAMQRAGHLVASQEGSHGKRLLLIGHLDTVFEKDSPVQLWNRNGGVVRGQGVADMKGGNVIIVEALRALHSVGALDGTTITVVFSGDEERVGEPKALARADLIEAAKKSEAAIAFEGTVRDEGGNDTATIGRRSSSSWTLKVSGKQGHSAGIFWSDSGYGAVYEGARILNAFREQLVEPDLTFNPGVVLGGTDVKFDEIATRGTAFGKNNVIANTFRAEGDLRYLSAEIRDRTWAKMRAIVASNLSGTTAEISFAEHYPAMPPTEGNLRLLKLQSQASEDAGLGRIAALPAGLRGAGDVQFAAPFVDSLDGIGATGSGVHSPNEELEIASIERASIRAAILIYRLTR